MSPILSANVRRNPTVDISNVFMASKVHNSENNITNVFVVLLILIFLDGKKIAPPYSSPGSVHDIFNDRLWAPLLLRNSPSYYYRFSKFRFGGSCRVEAPITNHLKRFCISSGEVYGGAKFSHAGR